jgi:hypothetical protein
MLDVWAKNFKSGHKRPNEEVSEKHNICPLISIAIVIDPKYDWAMRLQAYNFVKRAEFPRFKKKGQLSLSRCKTNCFAQSAASNEP